MATKGEMFVRWYLRFNGYFSIENFVVHDAGSQPRITRGGGKIPQRTECDLLGVRLPYSKEVVPQLCMADHLELTLRRFVEALGRDGTEQLPSLRDVARFGVE